MPPLYRCWTEATDAESGTPRRSANWIVSRRAWFKVYADRIECGDWVIPSAEVRSATLFEARQWFVPVFVLSVQAGSRTYQFGFNPWVRVAEHLPFAFRRERVSLRMSPFSVALRVLLVAYVAYLIWRRFAEAA